jgi:ArsR family transcriptional regulator
MSKQSPLPMADAACCSPLVSEPVSEDEAAELAQLFKALADPIRLRLLSLIGAHRGGREPGAGVCVCDLTGALLERLAGLLTPQPVATWPAAAEITG